MSRGVLGLQAWVDKLWAEKQIYYLGEWHSHPSAPAMPSETDDSQMSVISEDSKAKCPEPILLVVGGGPDQNWEPRAYVYPQGGTRIELLLQ